MSVVEKKEVNNTIHLSSSIGQAEPYVWFWYDIPNTYYHVSGYGETATEAKFRFIEGEKRLKKFFEEKGIEDYLENTVFEFD